MEGTEKFMRERERERGKKGHKSSHVSLIWGQSKERWALASTSHGREEAMIPPSPLSFTAHPL